MCSVARISVFVLVLFIAVFLSLPIAWRHHDRKWRFVLNLHCAACYVLSTSFFFFLLFFQDDYVRKVEDGATLNESKSCFRASFCCCQFFLFYFFKHHLVAVFVDTDGTKDPCHNVKCSRHKLCVAHASQRPVCVTRKKLEQRYTSENTFLGDIVSSLETNR